MHKLTSCVEPKPNDQLKHLYSQNHFIFFPFQLHQHFSGGHKKADVQSQKLCKQDTKRDKGESETKFRKDKSTYIYFFFMLTETDSYFMTNICQSCT